VNQEEIELAERRNNLLSIILHCASHVFNTVIDFSKVQANIELIYPTCPELVQEFLGYHSLEDLLIKYRQNLNLLWDKLYFLATVRPENLDLFLQTPDKNKPPRVENWLSDPNILRNSAFLKTMKQLKPSQIQLLLKQGVFPFDFINYKSKLSIEAANFIVSLILKDNLTQLENLISLLNANLIDCKWLNTFFEGNFSPEKSLGGSLDKDKILGNFSETDLNNLAEQLEFRSLMEDQTPNPNDIFEELGGPIALAEENEPWLNQEKFNQKPKTLSSAEKLENFLNTWNITVFEEIVVGLLTQTTMSMLINDPEIGQSINPQILRILRITIELSSAEFEVLIQQPYFQIVITESDPAKVFIFEKILDLLVNQQTNTPNSAPNSKPAILQLLQESDFFRSVFLIFDRTQNSNPKKEWSFLTNLTAFIQAKLITANNLAILKGEDSTYLRLVETIDKLTTEQVESIIQKLQSLSSCHQKPPELQTANSSKGSLNNQASKSPEKLLAQLLFDLGHINTQQME